MGVNFAAPDAVPIESWLEWSGDMVGGVEERGGAENLREASLEEAERGREVEHRAVNWGGL